MSDNISDCDCKLNSETGERFMVVCRVHDKSPSDNLNKVDSQYIHSLLLDYRVNLNHMKPAQASAIAMDSIEQFINNEKIEAVKDALTKSEEAKQPSVSKPLTLDRLKNLVGRNLRKNEPDYGRRQFVMGYNQAKDEIRERILTW